MSKYLKLLILMLAAMMILVACGGADTETPVEPETGGEETAVDDNLVISNSDLALRVIPLA